METESFDVALPDKKECKDFTESEAIDYLSKVIDDFERIQHSNSMFYDLVLRLSTSYFDYYNKFIDAICELFLKRNIIKQFLKVLTEAIDVHDRSIVLMFTFLSNFSDHSENFACDIGKSKMLDLIIDLLLKETKFEELISEEIYEFIYKCVVIINNFARNPENSVTYQVESIKKCLLEFIHRNTNDKLGIVSILTVSYLVEDGDVHILNECAGIVNHLIEQIKSTIVLAKRTDGFTLHELVHGLRCASANDCMKERICEASGIPVVIEILNNNRGKAVEPALGIIEQLCFNDSIKQKLINDFQIEGIVKRFSKDKCEKIRKLVDGILWNIRDHGKSLRLDRKGNGDSSSYDVFFSYSWANKQRVYEILELFRKSQICVWIDEEQVRGSCFESMAKGIENSRLIVIAMSRSYYRSPNCRREAEYAARINKRIIPLRMELKYRPVSWLGLIAGAELYYEFSGHRDTEAEALRLVQSVRANLGAASSDSGDEGRATCRLEFVNRSASASSTLRKGWKEWTKPDVVRWLGEYELGHLSDSFRRIDGSLLLVMLDIRVKSADYFNQSLRHEFGMGFVDVLLFHKALNDLVLTG